MNYKMIIKGGNEYENAKAVGNWSVDNNDSVG